MNNEIAKYHEKERPLYICFYNLFYLYLKYVLGGMFMERSTVYRRKADFDSCFSGFFRLFDPAGLMNHQYRNTNVFNKSNGLSKDRELMASDWGIVGGELKNSIKKLESEIHG